MLVPPTKLAKRRTFTKKPREMGEIDEDFSEDNQKTAVSQKTDLTGLKIGETASRGAGRNPRAGECEELTWEEAVCDYVRQMHGGNEIKTQQFYRSQLTMLGRHMTKEGVRVQDFRVRHMRGYIAGRAEAGLTERTRRHDVVAARAFCRFCASERYMPVNPLADYAVPKAEQGYRKSPSEAEVKAVLVAITARWNPQVNPGICRIAARTRTFMSRRSYAIIAGAVDSGCRIGEMLALHLSDYDADQGVIHIRKSKGNRPRTLPVSAEWQKAVNAWLRVRPKCDSPFLFITRYGEEIGVKQYGDQFQAYREFARKTYEARCSAEGTPASDAFLSRFTLHGLRHYSATLLSEAGWEVARKMLGHSSVTTTQGYVHSGAKHLRGGHAEAGPLSRLVTKDFLVSKQGNAKRRRLV